MNILFFSNNCESSKTLINLMQNENLLKFFHMQCTDGNKNIPPQIKVTPTIIIKGIPVPYAAGDAFAWFSRVKQWRINTQIQRMSEAQQKYLKSVNNNLVGNQYDETRISNFSKEEMDGLSDMFAFLQEGDSPLQHSYFTYNKIGQENIITPPKETNKISADKYRKMRTDMESERRKQDEAFKQHIENFKNKYS